MFELFFDSRLESKKSELLKDIEVYKIKLEKEKGAFMVKIEQDKQKFQSELERQLTEHSILFNSLNTERFRLCNELFGVLVNILGMGGYNVDIDPSAGHTDPSMEFVSQSN